MALRDVLNYARPAPRSEPRPKPTSLAHVAVTSAVLVALIESFAVGVA
jgi:hypothetical protein